MEKGLPFWNDWVKSARRCTPFKPNDKHINIPPHHVGVTPPIRPQEIRIYDATAALWRTVEPLVEQIPPNETKRN